MKINLFTTAWLPVIRRSGRHGWIMPSGLADADDPPVALDFPRPDWNAAVSEFLIGLLALALHPADTDAWADVWDTPPSVEALASVLAPLAPAFNLDGDGPLAFQDFASLGNAEEKPVSALLIDAPGENTLKRNVDLFVKRGGADALCPAYAAAALITLQTYAPSGGAGHRTSLRGGGPLSVLVDPRGADHQPGPLWRRLWANVPTVPSGEIPEGAPLTNPEWAKILPWTAETITSEAKTGTMVTPETALPLLAFFACPRRVRLVFSPANGDVCALGGPASDELVRGFRTRNYGANYMAWTHPLSPYREDKVSGRLPIHPGAGPSSWRDWLGWWGFGDGDKVKGYPPESVIAWGRRSDFMLLNTPPPRLSAFGFDMDNAKARQWLDQTIPWIDVTPENEQEDVRSTVAAFVNGAREAAFTLRFQTKLALYGQRQKDGYRLPESLPRDALNELSDALWSRTEAPFRTALRLIFKSPDDDRREREGFLPMLRRESLMLFDGAVDMEALADQDPRRLVIARNLLDMAFTPWGKVAKALKIAVDYPKVKEPA